MQCPPAQQPQPCSAITAAVCWHKQIDSIDPLLCLQIEAAHAALVAAHPLRVQLLGGCDKDLLELKAECVAFDPLMPFDAKHATQNASIVGECQCRVKANG